MLKKLIEAEKNAKHRCIKEKSEELKMKKKNRSKKIWRKEGSKRECMREEKEQRWVRSERKSKMTERREPRQPRPWVPRDPGVITCHIN